MCGSMSRGTRQDKSGDLSSVSHAYSFRHIDERGTQHVAWGGGFGIGASSYDVDTGIRGRGSERVNDGALRPVGQLEENVSGVVKRSAPGNVSNRKIDATEVARFADHLRDFCPLAAKPSGAGSGSRGSMDVLDSGVRASLSTISNPSREQHASTPSSHSLHAVNAVPAGAQPPTFRPSIEAAGPWVVPIRGDLDVIAS